MSDTKLPSLGRRPAGLTKELEAGIVRAARDLTADDVRAHVEGGEASDAAIAFLSARPSVEPTHVWWALERRNREARQRVELGLDAEEGGDEGGDEVARAAALLRERYVYASHRDEVYDRRARAWISTRAMDNAEAHAMPLDDEDKPLSAFQVFRRDKRADRVHNERFIPSEPAEIAQRDGVQWLNTWTAPTVSPAAGDASPMTGHILYLCNGNRAHAAHLADWMAYAAQNPGEKINHAPLIISGHQGVGKDTLGIALARVLGEANSHWIQDDAVSEGRFDFMKDSQLVVVPEVMSGERREVANKLKPLLTQTTCLVNEKHVKPYYVDNVANFLMFSNHENAAYIEDRDRRYFVIICQEEPRDPAYYDRLYEWIQGDGIRAFAHFLLNRDLSHFNPKANAPHTEHKDTVRDATRTGVEGWLKNAWENRDHPFDRDVAPLNTLCKQTIENGGPRSMTVQHVAKFLKSVGGADLGRQRVGPKGEQQRVWAVRHADRVAQLDRDSLQRLCQGLVSLERVEHEKSLEVIDCDAA